jgi:hypothetical protein
MKDHFIDDGAFTPKFDDESLQLDDPWTGVEGWLGAVTSASAGSRWGFGPASSSRARAMLSAQEALANRP